MTLELRISPLPLPITGRAWLATLHDILQNSISGSACCLRSLVKILHSDIAGISMIVVRFATTTAYTHNAFSFCINYTCLFMCRKATLLTRYRRIGGYRPKTLGNLGGIGRLKSCEYWTTDIRQRKFFQVEFGGFLQISNSFFNGIPLAGSTHFRTFSNVKVILFMDDRSKGSYSHSITSRD